jgi:hypothetical protein
MCGYWDTKHEFFQFICVDEHSDLKCWNVVVVATQPNNLDLLWIERKNYTLIKGIKMILQSEKRALMMMIIYI